MTRPRPILDRCARIAARRQPVAVVIALAAISGCGGGSHPSSPATTPSVGVPPPTLPPISTPVGARLAIGTAEGMEIWSVSTGVFPIGPSERNVTISHVAWSADGRELSWQTAADGSRAPRRELWEATVASGLTEHWGPLTTGPSYGPVVVTAAGVFTIGSSITRYGAGTGRKGAAVVVPAQAVPAGTPSQSWLHGWVIEPTGSPTGQSVLRVTGAGAPLPPGVVLDAGTSGGLGFDLEAVDNSGRHFAAELGHHTSGCEEAGTAQLWTASLDTGAVHNSTPPVSVPGVSERFWALDVTGPSGTVYASTFDCATHGKARGRAVDTTLWRFRAGSWHRVGPHLVAADRVGLGPLATIAGDIEVVRGVAAVTGTGAVSVGGRVVATGGQVIAWSPARHSPRS